MEGVVVAVEAVEECCLFGCLKGDGGIGGFVLGGWEILCSRSFWTAPSALAYEECGADGASVADACDGVDDVLLGFYDGAGLAFVVDAEDLGAQLEGTAGGGGGEGFEELD